MLTAVLQWITIEQLFTLLMQQEFLQDKKQLPSAQLPAIPDQILLQQLVPTDLYQAARKQGWLGLHALSFALRHQITQLQLLFHGQEEVSDAALQGALLETWRLQQGDAYRPLFGFSPLGIYCHQRLTGSCRAFDALSLSFCAGEATPVFCAEHSGEAFWLHPDAGTNQAKMFHYYADLKNFALYGEQDLERMLEAFWQRYRRADASVISEALASFGLRDAEALCRCGLVALRRQYLRLSRQHHPDCGGEAPAFIQLQAHYQQLKSFLESC